MSAIMTAIRSLNITRLGLTYDYLPRDAQRKIKRMSDLLDPRHNHDAYKTALKGYDPVSCIPWLGNHTPR